jgi:hypothetical protein
MDEQNKGDWFSESSEHKVQVPKKKREFKLGKKAKIVLASIGVCAVLSVGIFTAVKIFDNSSLLTSDSETEVIVEKVDVSEGTDTSGTTDRTTVAYADAKYADIINDYNQFQQDGATNTSGYEFVNINTQMRSRSQAGMYDTVVLAYAYEDINDDGVYELLIAVTHTVSPQRGGYPFIDEDHQVYDMYTINDNGEPVRIIDEPVKGNDKWYTLYENNLVLTFNQKTDYCTEEILENDQLVIIKSGEWNTLEALSEWIDEDNLVKKTDIDWMPVSHGPGQAKNTTKTAAAPQLDIPLTEAGFASLTEVLESISGQWTDGNGSYIYFSDSSHNTPIQFKGPATADTNGTYTGTTGQYSINEGETTKIKINIKQLSNNDSILADIEYIDVGIKGDNTIYINGQPWTYVSLDSLYQ